MAMPYFPLYPADYLSGTQRFTAAQHGQYILLLLEQWAEGRIPDDPEVLTVICKGSVPGPAVLAKFPDGINPRLELERVKAAGKSEKARHSVAVREAKRAARSSNDGSNDDQGSGIERSIERSSIKIKSKIKSNIQEQEQDSCPPQAAPGKPEKSVKSKLEDFPEDFQFVWKATTPESRQRSGLLAAFTAWRESGAEKEADRAKKAVSAMAQTKSWKEGFAPGLHRWLKSGGWMTGEESQSKTKPDYSEGWEIT